jgi:hypothetical protein
MRDDDKDLKTTCKWQKVSIWWQHSNWGWQSSKANIQVSVLYSSWPNFLVTMETMQNGLYRVLWMKYSQASNCVKMGFGSLHCNGVPQAPVQRKWTAFDWPSIMTDPGGSIWRVSHFVLSNFSFLWVRLGKQLTLQLQLSFSFFLFF